MSTRAPKATFTPQFVAENAALASFLLDISRGPLQDKSRLDTKYSDPSPHPLHFLSSINFQTTSFQGPKETINRIRPCYPVLSPTKPVEVS